MMLEYHPWLATFMVIATCNIECMLIYLHFTQGWLLALGGLESEIVVMHPGKTVVLDRPCQAHIYIYITADL